MQRDGSVPRSGDCCGGGIQWLGRGELEEEGRPPLCDDPVGSFEVSLTAESAKGAQVLGCEEEGR